MLKKAIGRLLLLSGLLLVACSSPGGQAELTPEVTLPPAPTVEPTAVPATATTAPTETAAPTQAPTPTEAATTAAPADLDTFINQFQLAVAARDFTALQGMMADPFAFGFWLSEGLEMSAAEAAAELEGNYLPEGASIIWADPDTDLAPLLQGQPPATFLGPDKQVVAALLSHGWGVNGVDEAIQFITRQPDGAYKWSLMLYSGFGFPGLLTDVPAVVITADEATFYSGPGTQYEPVATVVGGMTYPVIGVSADNAWWRLECFGDANELLPWCWVSADPAITSPTTPP